MTTETAPIEDLRVEPVTRRRWRDLETLFGEKGAYGGCWCMYWRIRHTMFRKQTAEEHRAGLKKIVNAGKVPGVIAYVNGEPAGWCSIDPREDFEAFERSKVFQRVDDEPVWSITCFYVAKGYRGKGLALHLLKGAVDYAAKRGAKIVEGYPSTGEKPMADVSAYKGIAAMFRKAGFVEVKRPSPHRIIMRYTIDDTREKGKPATAWGSALRPKTADPYIGE
jgi:GNAT superfamily N-acetyltransferase